MWQRLALGIVVAISSAGWIQSRGDEPLHVRVDAIIAAHAGEHIPADRADDAEFCRRIYLDLAGRVPTAVEARLFLDDPAAGKRSALVETLLASDDYPRRMREAFHLLWMERRGDDPEWNQYLERSFAANKPFDQLVREVIAPNPDDEATRASAFFYSKRLENYGQNPVDYPALTRDVGRMFLGVDLQCAQCHDHLFVDEYKQVDFQGLFVVYSNLARNAKVKFPAIIEKPIVARLEFQSVFDKVKQETGPRLPGGEEIPLPEIEKGKEYEVPPDPKAGKPGVLKFSALKKLAEQLPRRENSAFARNAVNQLWFLLFGRGIIHPLDLAHAGNRPAQPELLELLATEFAAHDCDVKWLIRELVLTEAYQRSSRMRDGAAAPPPELFLVGIEKRLSAEQLLASMLVATGAAEKYPPATADKPFAIPASDWSKLRDLFTKAFANPPQEPETEFAPSLQAALFVLNEKTVQGWLEPEASVLVQRLAAIEDSQQLAEELYLSVLARRPVADEQTMVAEHLAKHADRRPIAIGQLAWALLASTEFCVNH